MPSESMMRFTFSILCLFASLIPAASVFAEDAKEEPAPKQADGADRAATLNAPTPMMLVHAREMAQARQRMARLAQKKWIRTGAPLPYFSHPDYMGYLYMGYQRPTPYPSYGPFPL